MLVQYASFNILVTIIYATYIHYATYIIEMISFLETLPGLLRNLFEIRWNNKSNFGGILFKEC